jgi:hypothetical protein
MKTTLLFLAGVGLQELITLLFVIGIIVLLFLAIRSIMLWYWKIDKIEALLRHQINQNNEMIALMKKSQSIPLTDAEKAKMI